MFRTLPQRPPDGEGENEYENMSNTDRSWGTSCLAHSRVFFLLEARHHPDVGQHAGPPWCGHTSPLAAP